MNDEVKTLHSAAHWGAFRVHVQGGRVVSVLPFEHDPEPSPLINAFPEMVYSSQRVAQPLVRRGWLAGDGGAARGDDEYVPLSWDEALDRGAAEIDRVRKTYGNQAIFGGSYGWSSAGRVHHARTLLHRFLNCTGGFVGQVTNYSFGAAMAFIPRVVGESEAMRAPLATLPEVAQNAEVVLAFGGLPAKNWAVQSGGSGEHSYRAHMRSLAANDVRVVTISPFGGDRPEGVASEWLPIRPNSDTALILVMIRLVCEWDAQDQGFIDRYTTGFERLRAYLDGATDGIVKSPEWASELTGIPASAIIDLARSLVGRKVMLTATWSLQRARHGEQPYWALIALAAALGQIGRPGLGYAFGYGSMNGNGNCGYDTPVRGLPVGPNPVGLDIPVARMADLLLQPGETIRFDGSPITYPDIRLVYWAGGNPFHHHQDLNRLRQAFRRPECIIVNEQYRTATARHADIVFPATTTLERNDIGGSSRDPFLLAMQKAIEPVGQARNDYDIFRGLASRLGLEDAFTEGRDSGEWLRWAWDETRKRLSARGIAAPDFDSFFADGFLRMPEPERDPVPFEAFRRDPEANPLQTPSGRIEIHSAAVAAMGDPEQPGHPVWLDPEEWLGSEASRRHPLHLLTPQPERRLHGQMEQSAHSRAGKRDGYEVLRMSRTDAEARSITSGDLVRIFNFRGACLASAEPSDDVLPGVVLLPTGADFAVYGADAGRSGNPNALTRDIGTSNLGQGCAAQSCLVDVERAV